MTKKPSWVSFFFLIIYNLLGDANMKIYSEIISKSLIDFEEIKFILANNNIELVRSEQVKERYFLSNDITFKSASYKKILENIYILEEIENKMSLVYKTYSDYHESISKIEIVSEEDCIDFLNHIGFKEIFTIEKNIYDFSDGVNEFSVINLINTGLYLSVKKENATIDELKQILDSFKIPYKEDECNESIEKIMISKIRRYLK